MTIQEISLFINELSKIQETEGWGRAYEAAMEKLREYPSCDLLILNTALWLDGAAILSGVAPAENIKTVSDTPRNIPPAISDETEALYRSVMDSSDEQIRSQARSMLISRYIGRGQYHEAEELIESLPDKSQVDKKQLEINLYISQGKIEEAARAEEERLLAAARRAADDSPWPAGYCAEGGTDGGRGVYCRGFSKGGKLAGFVGI